ncbi:hypothetical protein FFM54_24550 [Burkholderia pseudomallei]|nr:hypothetical protein FFM54_24550 [Burkholderia pseudomallei]
MHRKIRMPDAGCAQATCAWAAYAEAADARAAARRAPHQFSVDRERAICAKRRPVQPPAAAVK